MSVSQSDIKQANYLFLLSYFPLTRVFFVREFISPICTFTFPVRTFISFVRADISRVLVYLNVKSFHAI